MKKLFFIAAFVFITGCSSSKGSLEGTICMIGNEPFTSIAIQVDSVTVYKLDADQDVLKELSMNQGKVAKISYCKVDSSESPKKIKIKKYEYIK